MRHTREALEAKSYEEMTSGERNAATKMGLYPKGYRRTLLCSLCGKGPYYNSHSVCRQCYIDTRRDGYMKDECPKCGKSKAKVSPHCQQCSYEYQVGDKAANWRGGRTLDKDGYVYLYVVGHPRDRGGRNRIQEHVLVMEAHIGRYLYEGETVHHKNGQRNDNRIENLELWASNHPYGQRVEDLAEWCKSFMKDYPQLFDGTWPTI